jgi:hypothetical protein
VKSLQTTDDGRQVMAIVHMELWSRWTNKVRWNNVVYFFVSFSRDITQWILSITSILL